MHDCAPAPKPPGLWAPPEEARPDWDEVLNASYCLRTGYSPFSTFSGSNNWIGPDGITVEMACL
mgnify:CR=1 FL=1